MKEQRFVFTHGFRVFSLWLLDPIHLGNTLWWKIMTEEVIHLIAQEIEKEEGTEDQA